MVEQISPRLRVGFNAKALDGGRLLKRKLLPPLTPPQAGGIKLALVGFSQGTMTALNVGLRRDDVACILGYSGSLLEDDASIRTVTHKPLVCLIHGEQDDVVPFTSMPRAKELLETQRIDVETHARPNLGHSIDMEGIMIGGKFLVGSVK